MADTQQHTETTQAQQQENVSESTLNGSPQVDTETGKFVHVYQPLDKEGNAIGRPYRYLYTDQADLVNQLTESQKNAARFIHEVKTGKRQLVEGEKATPYSDFRPKDLSQDEQFATTVGLQNPAQSRLSFRKLMEAELGAPVEEVRQNIRSVRDTNELLTAQNWALQAESKGYYICRENGEAMTKWLSENNLAMSPKNYDLAFEELRDTLVPRPSDTSHVQTPAQATTQEANTSASATKRTASTGIQPGQFSGKRETSQQTPKLSIERFTHLDKMKYSDFLKFKRNSPDEYAKFIEMKAGISS